MQCPVCEYEAAASEFGEPAKCPACGVYYQKALANKLRIQKSVENSTVKVDQTSFSEKIKQGMSNARQSVGEGQRITFSDWLNSNPHMKVVGALVLGLLVGYFAGREHVKYEIKSALQDSFKGLAGVFSGSSDSKHAEKVAEVIAPGVVRAMLVSKEYADGEHGRGTIDIGLRFTNDSEEDIRAFDGVLSFTDLLGNKIIDSNVAINEVVKAGEDLSWVGSIGYNEFIERHKNFRFAENKNIKLNFILKKVLYADGRLQQY